MNYIAGAAETTVRAILVALTGEQAVSSLIQEVTQDRVQDNESDMISR